MTLQARGRRPELLPNEDPVDLNKRQVQARERPCIRASALVGLVWSYKALPSWLPNECLQISELVLSKSFVCHPPVCFKVRSPDQQLLLVKFLCLSALTCLPGICVFLSGLGVGFRPHGLQLSCPGLAGLAGYLCWDNSCGRSLFYHKKIMIR